MDPTLDSTIIKHYLSDDLMGFRDEDSTGRQGAVLIVDAPIGQYTADASGFVFNTTLGGSSSGLAIATVIFGVVD